MDFNPYTVIKFEESTFHTLFSVGEDKNLHARKNQVIYLGTYLKAKGAKTVIIENDYIDRSYLEDYSAYYSRCFNSYEKKCKRLHFFKDYGPLPGISEEEFYQWLIHGDGILTSERLEDNYLGFIVVKPLPETVIGRTCLEAYPGGSGNIGRCFPIASDYDVGLCGLTLKVKNTLPFQEQDKVTSACATSALWTLFHGATGHSKQIKSPSSITKIATRNNYSDRTDFPTPGLTPEMMGTAILSEGLEPFIISLTTDISSNSSNPLVKTKTYLYPYLRDKIPVLLAVDAFEEETKKHIGTHAITICGYEFKDINLKSRDIKEFILKSDFIEKIYAHDDQVGPFARLNITYNPINIIKAKESDIKYKKLNSYLLCNINKNKSYIYSPCNIIIGLYHKIRIPFSIIKDASAKFSDYIFGISSRNEFIKSIIYCRNEPLLWDIHLTSPTKVKSEIFKDVNVPPLKRQNLLRMNLPKYIWKVSASNSKGVLFDLLFDATDIPQGPIFIDMIERNSEFYYFFNFLCSSPNAIPDQIRENKYGLIYKILNKLCLRRLDKKPDLAVKFGYARPPLKYKPEEKNGLGEVIEHPNLIKVDEVDSGLSLLEKKYIWAISESGDIRLAPHCDNYGHPTLVEGSFARICGELYRESGSYILTNASGRYSKHSPQGEGLFLDNAKKLFEERIPSISISRCEASPYHGALSITDPNEFLKFADEANKMDADTDTDKEKKEKTFKILWEIGRKTSSFKSFFCTRNNETTLLSNDVSAQLIKFCDNKICSTCIDLSSEAIFRTK